MYQLLRDLNHLPGSHSSVLKEDTGNPSVPNRSPTTKSWNAYRTATGSETEGHTSVTPFPVIKALAGKNLFPAPATSKHESSFPKEVRPFGALSKVSWTVPAFTFISLKTGLWPLM